MDIRTYELSVESNFNDVLFSIDSKSYISGEDSFKGIVPDIYTVYGKVSINLAYKDAEVFNNTEADIIVEKLEDIEPIINYSSISLYIEEFSWGINKSFFKLKIKEISLR